MYLGRGMQYKLGLVVVILSPLLVHGAPGIGAGMTKFRFKEPGGSKAWLGTARLERIHSKNAWRGSVDDLAKELDADNDLVSLILTAAERLLVPIH